MVAPFVIEGALNGETFRTYIEQCLVPTLKPGDIVVLDNVSTHKVNGVVEAIEAVGATLRYLPQYSPDLNPIDIDQSLRLSRLMGCGGRARNTACEASIARRHACRFESGYRRGIRCNQFSMRAVDLDRAAA